MTEPILKTVPPAAGKADVLRVTWGGLIVNLLLTGLKLVAGFVGASQAVVADAFHSLSDLSTDVAVLVGVRYWSAPPDKTHPYGHGKIETIVTASIGLALAAVAAGIGYSALATLHEKDAGHPGWIAFAAAAVSIVTKEALYRWTVRVGRRAKSPAVVANAWHHRSDALSSVPAAAAVAVAVFFPSWSFVDHVGALVVAMFILQAAWAIIKPTLGQLVERSASTDVRDRIERIVLDTPAVRSTHAIRARYVGSGLQVDLHIQVEPQMSVLDGHEVARQVRRRLTEQGPDVTDVIVHLEPYLPDGADAGTPARKEE